MNELYKVASRKRNSGFEPKNSVATMALLGSSGAMAYSAPKNVLGYHKVYHGTPRGHVAIKDQGLRKSMAGTGAGGVDVNVGHANPSDIKGKVFTTTNPEYAKRYTNRISALQNMDDVIKMRVPYRHKGRMARDTVVDRIINREIDGVTDDHVKQFKQARKVTRVYKHSIPARFIEGSDKYKGVKQFLNKGHIRRYLAQPGGKARMALGVGQLLGAGALAYGAAKIAGKKK